MGYLLWLLWPVVGVATLRLIVGKCPWNRILLAAALGPITTVILVILSIILGMAFRPPRD